jgi:hypothetical protein
MVKRTIPITRRALVARLNRKLKADDQMIKFPRSERVKLDLGDAYVWDWRRNLALETFVDVEDMARELGVLHEWERLVDDEVKGA